VDARVNAVVSIIHRSVTDRLSIHMLSKSVNLSPSRLRQLFKTETGLSPMQYVKHVRLERAANLLRSTFLSVKEVIFRSGAGDPSNFVREFKKHYGVTPSELRARSGSSPKTPMRTSRRGE